jgi:hypothetical protein
MKIKTGMTCINPRKNVKVGTSVKEGDFQGIVSNKTICDICTVRSHKSSLRFRLAGAKRNVSAA